MKKKLNVKAYGISDVGRVRSKNEDYYALSENVFIVADGMGGHKSGDVASKLTVETIMDFFDEQKNIYNGEFVKKNISEKILNAIFDANSKVLEKATERRDFQGMGTTLVIAFWAYPDQLYIANVGDSRAYHLRDNNLILMSKDHSVVGKMINMGELTSEKAREHPYRNLITQAVGLEAVIKPYYTIKNLRDGDIILLCSDGLWDMLPDEQIKRYLLEKQDPKELCEHLVAAANEAGGTDNITVVILYFFNNEK